MPFLFKGLAVLLIGATALLPTAAEAQAIEAWVQRYNGPGNGNDYPAAMAVDASGNVVVTGASFDPAGYGGYVTIKYSNAGVSSWTNYYSGPGNSGAGALAMAVDTSGNVLVTGSSSSGSGPNYATIKYSSSGVPLWTNTGPAGEAWAMAVDASGNVVVMGTSNNECTTVKYSSAGALLWARDYSLYMPTGLAVSADGSVVVTGWSRDISAGFEDYMTFKYSSAGQLLWSNTYDGGYVGPYGGGADRANAVVVDASDNVFVTGRSDTIGYVTIKYSGAGKPLWTNSYGGSVEARALVVDGDGNVIVTGGNPDYATIKYSNPGVPWWTNQYLRPGNYGSTATAVTLDASGNVYVTGSEDLPGWPPNAADWITVAYSRDGVPLWTNSYNGPASSMDMASAIAADTSGNIYVTGSSRNSTGDGDMVTIKYVTPPLITRQPLSCTNAVGFTASLTVEAAGSLPFSYQWRRDGTNLLDGGRFSGMSSTNLVIANVQLADAAGYSVVITNTYGSTTSHVAQLTVALPANPGRFSNFSYSPATGFSFIFRDGTVGQPYRIQVAPSLAGGWVDWTSLNYTAPRLFTDLEAVGISNRFYRAVSP